MYCYSFEHQVLAIIVDFKCNYFINNIYNFAFKQELTIHTVFIWFDELQNVSGQIGNHHNI